MKRKFITLILLAFSIMTYAQWNENSNIDGKCSHIPQNVDRSDLLGLYNWQSPYLFDYDVTFYRLDIEVSSDTIFVGGNGTINGIAMVPLDTFAFELIPDQNIDSIWFNGVRYDNYYRDGNNVLVPVDEINTGTSFSAVIYYHGTPLTGGFFSGVTHAYSDTYNQPVTWTLSEPFAAKDWFPVKQDLEDKADSCWVFLTTTTNNMAGSQGLLTNVVELGNSKHRFEWKSNYPIDYYLISFAVADYQEYNVYSHPAEMNGDSILIQNFIYNSPGCLEANKAGIDQTVEFIEVLSDKYILYPFWQEKYGHCLTQLGGGMEHQTMTTIGGFSFHLVAHELGHMWFGDNVTCATWSDIWINEGFATYSDYLATEYIQGWDDAKALISSKQNNAMSSAGGSIYIPEEEVYPGNEYRIFSGRLSYDKGAAIIHTLRHEIQNDSLFFAVMKTFQTNFTGSTATGDDFKNTAEQVTGMDFGYFFDQWYYGEGYPIYDLDWYSSDNTFFLSSTQSTSSTTPFFKMIMEYKLLFLDGTDTIVKLQQTSNFNSFEIETGKKVGLVMVDTEKWTMEKVNSLIVNINEIDSATYFTVGPNPVLDHVTVYFHNDTIHLRTIDLMDLEGRVIQSVETNLDEIQINTTALSKGIYLIKVSNGQKSMIRKLIK
ncbi:MAG: M1 family aminopeptidase [Bacteroidales bacterium]|nr:M1 family aminopeptidase [Bacteroidales bacterium]